MKPKQIKAARNEMGLTQKDMGALWGYTRSYWQQIELGSCTTPRLLEDAISWKLFLHRNKK